MADKGIIFSAPMVRALLDGRKTQTRRLLKSQPVGRVWDVRRVGTEKATGRPAFNFFDDCNQPIYAIPTAYGYKGEYVAPYASGDRLYVREAFGFNHYEYERGRVPSYRPDDLEDQHLSYRATEDDCEIRSELRYRPSIHMPRWASRLWLAVTDVRVQRLQDIAEAEAIAEGVVWQEPSEEDLQWAAEQAVEYGTSADLDGVWLVPGTDGGDGRQIWGCTPQQAYQFLWNSLHTEPGTRWQDNPWIVAVSFDVNNGNIDGGANG